MGLEIARAGAVAGSNGSTIFLREPCCQKLFLVSTTSALANQVNLRDGPPRDLATRGFVVFGIYDYAAPWTLAIALGDQIRFFPQSQVHNPPLPRRHGRKVVGRAGPPHIFGCHRGRHAQFLQADRALVLAIERYLLVLSRGQPQNLLRQQFQ